MSQKPANQIIRSWQTIVAAMLNKIYSFTDPFGSEWTYWYVRESSTALLVGNLPFVWALWRRVGGGSRTIDEISRRGSGLPTVSERGEKKNAIRRDSIVPWITHGREGSLEDLGLEDRPAARGLTLAEMLRERSRVSVDGKDSSVYPDPWLSSARGQREPANVGSMQRAILGERIETETVRRNSGPDERHLGTPSSPFPHSLNSQKSEGSFL